MHRISVLTVNGSPKNIDFSTVENRGVGGAELALVTWSELLAKSNNYIYIYNQLASNIHNQEIFDNGGVTFLSDNLHSYFNDSDILVTFRGPHQDMYNSGKKHIGWSCDQITMGDYVDWYNTVDKMVLISEFHKRDHIMRYGKELVESKAEVIDLGVRDWEYLEPVEKIPYQFIYCSVPARGLQNVAVLWPEIKKIYPQATLIITSDYTLWGAEEPLNMEYRLMFAGLPGVKFVGKVSRKELVRYQMESEIQLYPCIYDENFCIANAECQVAGCYCITSAFGALETTNFTGKQILGHGLDNYLYAIRDFYNLDINTRKELSAVNRYKAISRFGWRNIAAKWNTVLDD